MARRVFFSFHYQRDIWRVNQIRNHHIVEGTAAAGFQDASLWERARLQGDAALKRLIDDGLNGTTVTAVLIGTETAHRRWVQYEIDASIARGNGILGVFVHNLRDQSGYTSAQGPIPHRLTQHRYPTYYWDSNQFGLWVERAARLAGHQ